jgi:hypothetical protein
MATLTASAASTSGPSGTCSIPSETRPPRPRTPASAALRSSRSVTHGAPRRSPEQGAGDVGDRDVVADREARPARGGDTQAGCSGAQRGRDVDARSAVPRPAQPHVAAAERRLTVGGGADSTEVEAVHLLHGQTVEAYEVAQQRHVTRC